MKIYTQKDLLKQAEAQIYKYGERLHRKFNIDWHLAHYYASLYVERKLRSLKIKTD